MTLITTPKLFLIFGPTRRICRNLGDQALLLGCLSKIDSRNTTYVLLARGTKLDFLDDYPYINIVFLPDIKFGLIVFIKDFLFFIFCILSFFPRRIREMNYIGADQVDGRWGPISPYFFFVLICNFLLSKRCNIRSFSYVKSHHPLNYFLLKMLSKNSFFYCRDSLSLNLFKKEIAPNYCYLEKDLSFSVKKKSFLTDIHLWIHESHSTGNKVFIFAPATRGKIDKALFFKEIAGMLLKWAHWKFIIVRHVFDDETLGHCEVMCQILGERAIMLDIPNVAIVRDITLYTDFAATCLMHFGLGAIANCIPTIILDYSNKANGILADLKIPHLVANSPEDFISKIEKYRDLLPSVTSEITSACRFLGTD